MLEQNLFMETLREVKEIIRTSAEPVTKEDMLSYFKDMDLSEEQKDMVFAYLITPEEEPVTAKEEGETDTENQNEQEDSAGTSSVQNSAVFNIYLEELANIPDIKSEELAAMYIKLLRGDRQVIGDITNCWMKKVVDMSEKFASAEYNQEDIIQEGNMGLYIELTRLCGCNEAVNVEDSLTEAVENAMKSYISLTAGERDSEQTVASKANLVSEAQKYLQEQNHKEPSLFELSEYTGMDTDELEDIISIITKAQTK